MVDGEDGEGGEGGRCCPAWPVVIACGVWLYFFDKTLTHLSLFPGPGTLVGSYWYSIL